MRRIGLDRNATLARPNQRMPISYSAVTSDHNLRPTTLLN
jgi:hypothetical protein